MTNFDPTIAGLILIAAGILLVLVVLIRRDGGQAEHEGWEGGEHTDELEQIVQEYRTGELPRIDDQPTVEVPVIVPLADRALVLVETVPIYDRLVAERRVTR